MNDNGRDYFRASIDTSQFDRDAANIQSTFRNIGNIAEREGAKIESSFKKAGTAVLGFFTFRKAAQFAKEVASITGEFQQLNIAFETMLGSKAKADALMTQLVDTAAKTPFDLKGVANGAKQLLAYGTASEEVNDTLIRLGNIASGLSIPLNNLVYLYGTSQVQGRLFSQDIYQFMGRGVPIISELAKEMGVAEESIMGMVSAGKIGFSELQKVIQNMTNEGGMFYNLMEKQSASITGQISNLEDAIDVALNGIGEKASGVFTSAISLASLLVENYETVGKVIASIVAVYGTYKAAVIALNVVQSMQTKIALESALAGKTLTTMQGLQAVFTKKLTVAQAALNKTMLANPYVLATMALVGLGYAVYKVITYQNEAEQAQNRLNDVIKESEKASLSETRELAKLKGELSAATKDSDQYNAVKEKIIKNYGKYYKGLRDEIEQVGLLESTYNKLTTAIRKSFGARQYESFMQSEQENLDNIMSENLGKIQDKLIKKLGDEAGSKYYARIRDGIIEGNLKVGKMYQIEGLDNETQSALDKISGKASNDWIQNFAIEGNIKKILDAQKLTDEIDKKARNKFGIEDDVNKEDGVDTETNKVQTFTEQLEEAKRKVAELKKELGNLHSGKTESKDYAKDIEDKAKELKQAEDKLSILLYGKTSSGSNAADSKASKILDAKRKLDEADKQRQIDKLDFENTMRQREIDNLDDSLAKKLKQLKLNFDKENQAIEEFKQRAAKSQYDEAKNQYIASNGTEKGFDQHFATLSDEQLSQILPEGLRPEDIAECVAAMNKAANDARLTGMKDLNKEINAMIKEQDLIFASSLEKDLADIDAYYASLIVKAEGNEALITQIKLNHQKARQEATYKDQYNEIDFSEQLEMERFQGLESIGMSELVEEKKLEITKKYTQMRIDVLRKVAELGDKDAGKQADLLQESLNKMDLQKPAKSLKALANKAIFNTIKSGFEKAGDSAEDAEGKTISVLSSLSSSAGMVANIAGELQGLFGGLDESMDMVLDTVGNIAQGFAQGGIVGGALALVGEGIKLFGKASEAEKRHQQALKEIAESRLASQRQYNLLLLEQNLLLEEATSIFGENQIQKAANAITQYSNSLAELRDEMQGSFRPDTAYEQQLVEHSKSNNVLIRNYFGKQLETYRKELENYNNGIAKLAKAEIVTGHKKTGLFGWGKGKDIYSPIIKEYNDILEKDGQLNKGRIQNILDTRKMTDETRKYLEHLIDLQEFAEKAQEELRGYLQETFGALGTGAIDTIVDSIKNGTDAWVEFGKVGSSVLEKLGEQLAYELFFSKVFQDLQDDLEKVFGSNKDSDQIASDAMRLVASFYQGIGSRMDEAQNFMENWQSQAEKLGFDLWKPDNQFTQSASKGYSVDMSQETGDSILGRVSGIYELDANAVDLLSKVSDTINNMYIVETDTNRLVNGFGLSIEEIRNIQLQSMYYLEDITKYTKVLPKMSTNIESIKKNIEEL